MHEKSKIATFAVSICRGHVAWSATGTSGRSRESRGYSRKRRNTALEMLGAITKFSNHEMAARKVPASLAAGSENRWITSLAQGFGSEVAGEGQAGSRHDLALAARTASMTWRQNKPPYS